MGVVHHSNYLVWFEAARVAWLDAVGIPYAEVAAGGRHLAVTAATVEYRRSARFGDRVRVMADVTYLRSRQVYFRYEVARESDGALLARGSTEHVCVNLEGSVASIPEDVMNRLRQVVGAAAQRQGEPHA